MPTAIASVSDLNGQIAKAGSKLVIIDFHAQWCGPCKVIGPVYERFEKQYPSAVFLKCDVDQARDVASKYSVSAMPTFVFLKNGSKVDQVRGANQALLEQTIKKNIGSGSTDSHSWGKGNALGDGAAATAPLTASMPSIPSSNQLMNGWQKLDMNSKIVIALVGIYVGYLFFG